MSERAEQTWQALEWLLTEECGLMQDCGLGQERPNLINIIENALADFTAECAQHLEEISRLQADIISKRGWVATPDGMRDARVAELEADYQRICRGHDQLHDERDEARDRVAKLEAELKADRADEYTEMIMRRVAELEAERDEWRQAAQVEACLRREFYDRMAELEGALRVALDIIGHPDDEVTKGLRAVLNADGSKKLFARPLMGND